jgi:hypothetical protein
MSRPLRFVPEDSLVEITTRTFQGRLLLRPSPELTDIILGIIGKAQARYGMTIHAFVFLSTHAHFLLSPTSAGQLARFVQFVNANVAKEAPIGLWHPARARALARGLPPGDQATASKESARCAATTRKRHTSPADPGMGHTLAQARFPGKRFGAQRAAAPHRFSWARSGD